MPNARPKTVIAEQAAIMVRRLDELRGFTLLIVIVALQRGWMVDRCSVFYPFVQRMILSVWPAGWRWIVLCPCLLLQAFGAIQLKCRGFDQL